jgi:LPXTG-motif cell wall-anchored protein
MRFGFNAAVTSAYLALAGSAFANPAFLPFPLPLPLPLPGHRAPAPEMGASMIGLVMVAALAYYVVRRRRNAMA